MPFIRFAQCHQKDYYSGGRCFFLSSMQLTSLLEIQNTKVYSFSRLGVSGMFFYFIAEYEASPPVKFDGCCLWRLYSSYIFPKTNIQSKSPLHFLIQGTPLSKKYRHATKDVMSILDMCSTQTWHKHAKNRIRRVTWRVQ